MMYMCSKGNDEYLKEEKLDIPLISYFLLEKIV